MHSVRAPPAAAAPRPPPPPRPPAPPQEARQQGARPSEAALLQLLNRVGSATRRLVKNQHTWFRDDGAFRWVDNGAPAEDVVGLILAEVGKPAHEGARAG